VIFERVIRLEIVTEKPENLRKNQSRLDQLLEQIVLESQEEESSEEAAPDEFEVERIRTIRQSQNTQLDVQSRLATQ
jgi:hypothetical protein